MTDLTPEQVEKWANDHDWDLAFIPGTNTCIVQCQKCGARTSPHKLIVRQQAELAQERARNAELVEAGEYLLLLAKSLVNGDTVADLDEAIRRMELALTPPSTDRGNDNE